jgi:hypothetical protein
MIERNAARKFASRIYARRWKTLVR